jgi:hypothetical protein
MIGKPAGNLSGLLSAEAGPRTYPGAPGRRPAPRIRAASLRQADLAENTPLGMGMQPGWAATRPWQMPVPRGKCPIASPGCAARKVPPLPWGKMKAISLPRLAVGYFPPETRRRRFSPANGR